MLVEEQVCPLCLEWGPPTDSGFCATCQPPVRPRLPRHYQRLRLKHCQDCGRPFATISLHILVRCEDCRNRCKLCGEPCERPKGKRWGRNITCPRCLSMQRSAAARIGHSHRPPPTLEVECAFEGCTEICLRPTAAHTKKRYCDQHRHQIRVETVTRLNRQKNGHFEPLAESRPR